MPPIMKCFIHNKTSSQFYSDEPFIDFYAIIFLRTDLIQVDLYVRNH